MLLSVFFMDQLSKPYWGEAITCTTYLHNCCPTKAIPPNTTPFEPWHKQNLWQSLFCRIPDPLLVKLDNKTHECIFLGYSSLSKGYKVQQISNGATITSSDVVLEELGSEYFSATSAPRPSDSELQKDPWFYQPIESSNIHCSGTGSGIIAEVIPSDRPPSSLPPLSPLDAIMVRPATSPHLTVLLPLDSSVDQHSLLAQPVSDSLVLPLAIHQLPIFPSTEALSSVYPCHITFSFLHKRFDSRLGLELMPHLGKHPQPCTNSAPQYQDSPQLMWPVFLSASPPPQQKGCPLQGTRMKITIRRHSSRAPKNQDVLLTLWFQSKRFHWNPQLVCKQSILRRLPNGRWLLRKN